MKPINRQTSFYFFYTKYVGQLYVINFRKIEKIGEKHSVFSFLDAVHLLDSLKIVKVDEIKEFLSKTFEKLRNNEEPEVERQTHKLPVLVFLPIMGRRCKGKEC